MKYTFIEKILIALFVDNVLLAKYWRCHQLSERSFFVRGRQFHICARCTGIFTGYIFSLIFLILAGGKVITIFIICALIMALDGFTQLWELRESNNILRFITGFGFGLTFPAFCIEIILKICKLFS